MNNTENSSATDCFEIGIPDDWHLHLRQGQFLSHTSRASARVFRRAIIMPNLDPPVTTVASAGRYRREIIESLTGQADDESGDFEPLMTLYLTDETTGEEIAQAAQSPHIHGVKMYPKNATTGSARGVSKPKDLDHVYEVMAETGLILQVHGEIIDPKIDVFDREKRFIDTVMRTIAERHPRLRIVLEHITTRDSVEYVLSERRRMLATITPHHLWLNRNAMFENGGINPHHYCLPILKREQHRLALIEAATSGQDCFAVGSDSAPHLRSDKESACGCAGIYNAPCALETYAEIFDQAGALEVLEAFACHHGTKFYRLPANSGRIQFQRQSWRVPEVIDWGFGQCVPFRAGEDIAWTITKIALDSDRERTAS